MNSFFEDLRQKEEGTMQRLKERIALCPPPPGSLRFHAMVKYMTSQENIVKGLKRADDTGYVDDLLKAYGTQVEALDLMLVADGAESQKTLWIIRADVLTMMRLSEYEKIRDEHLIQSVSQEGQLLN